MTGPANPKMHQLEAASAGAWASLALAGGNPNHKGLPGLAVLHAMEKRQVMILDTPCRVENDPTGEVRQIMEKRGTTPGGIA